MTPALGPPSTPQPPKFNLLHTLLQCEKDLLSRFSFAQDPGNALWYYQNGRYGPGGEGLIEKELYNTFKASPHRMHWQPQHANRIITAAKLDSPSLWDKPAWTTLNLQNCQLHWNGRSWDKLSHNRGWLSPLQLAVNYDPSAECHAWRQLIKELLPDEDPDFTFKLIASLITPSTNNNQQAYLCLGEVGGEGKSTYIKGIQSFLGPDACITRSLQSLEENRFATAGLQGKLVLLDSDMETRVFKTTAVFKQIVTQDSVQCEYKGGKLFSFNPFCKVLMASNLVPRSQEGGNAWSRRWCIIPFSKILPPDKRRPPSEIDALLSHPTELSGLLNDVLPFVAPIALNGLTTTAEWATMITQESYWHDYAEAWIRQSFEHRQDHLLPPAEAYRRYCDWCEQKGRSQFTRKAFRSLVEKLYPRTIFDYRPSASSGLDRPPLLEASSLQILAPHHHIQNYAILSLDGLCVGSLLGENRFL